MNKKGLTIIELLLSISIISIIVLLLIRASLSFKNIEESNKYASNDEIARTEIIKEIESDFLKMQLIGLDIIENNNSTTIKFFYENTNKELIINQDSLTYNNIKHKLESKNATYEVCPIYKYKTISNKYLIQLNIPVLINGENTTSDDDIILTFLGAEKDNNNYPDQYNCSKK